MKKTYILTYVVSVAVIVFLFLSVDDMLKSLYVYTNPKYYQFFGNILRFYGITILAFMTINLYLLFKGRAKHGLASSLFGYYALLIPMLSLKPWYSILTLVVSSLLFFALIRSFNDFDIVHSPREPHLIWFFGFEQRVIIIFLFAVLALTLSIPFFSALDSVNMHGDSVMPKILFIVVFILFFWVSYISSIFSGEKYMHRKSSLSFTIQSALLTVLFMLITVLFI